MRRLGMRAVAASGCLDDSSSSKAGRGVVLGATRTHAHSPAALQLQPAHRTKCSNSTASRSRPPRSRSHALLSTCSCPFFRATTHTWRGEGQGRGGQQGCVSGRHRPSAHCSASAPSHVACPSPAPLESRRMPPRDPRPHGWLRRPLGRGPVAPPPATTPVALHVSPSPVCPHLRGGEANVHKHDVHGLRIRQVGLVDAVGQRRGRRLVQQAQAVEARQLRPGEGRAQVREL